MTTLTYQGKVSDAGQIDLPKRLRQEVSEQLCGKRIEVTFKQQRKTRSTPQNAYYWSVVIPYVLDGFIELGHDLQSGNADHKEMIHGLLKDKFLHNGIEVADANSELYTLPPSTRRCNVVEFMDYLDQIIRWAAECLNVTIPDSGEQGKFAFED